MLSCMHIGRELVSHAMLHIAWAGGHAQHARRAAGDAQSMTP